ncbi:MAG: peptidoglycan binding domain-containing protein [Anaerolineales bacterium]|nr:peptidoglycan binding domain-containing protein [Anaerolineales bacterium]
MPAPHLYPEDPYLARQSARPIVFRLPRRQRGTHLLLALAFLTAIGFAAVLLAAALGAALFYGYYELGERIYPGVSAGALDLGGATQPEAVRMLDKRWNQEASILVTNGLQNRLFTPGELGISLDARATTQSAYNIGRRGSLMARLAQIYVSWKDHWQIQPMVALDLQTARSALEATNPLMSKAPIDATIRVERDELVAVPAELGYSLNIDESLKTLQADAALVLQNGVLAALPQPVPAAISDATPLLTEAKRILDQPAIVQVYDPISDESGEYPIPRAQVASWLRVAQMDHQPQVSLDEAGVAAFLSDLSGQLGQGRAIDAARYSGAIAEALRIGNPARASVSHPSTRYLVQSGDTLLKLGWRLGIPYWMILQANPGINPDALIAGTELIIPSKDELLPLPTVPNKRIVISLARQRLAIYQDGVQIAQHVISTGINRSPTQPGVFQVRTHDKNAYASVWDLYMPNFLGIYEAWPGFMNGIHGLPTLSNGQRMWANSLGRPASYGCIILGLEEAKWLYNWAEDGVIVEIRE